MQTNDEDDEELTKEEQASMEQARSEWLHDRQEALIDKAYDEADAKTAWYNRVAFFECTREE
jgi:hypothetical protein